MIGLDTNVLARYIVREDPRQAAAATRLIESSCTADSPGVVTLIVLCELVWVLARGYRYNRAQVSATLRKILAAEDLHVERSEVAWQALNYYEAGKADYSDYLVALCGRQENAEVTISFDRRTSDCDLFRVLDA